MPPGRARRGALLRRARWLPAVAGGEPGARSVRRLPERAGHVGARNLEARIVEAEATTSRDQDEVPKSLYVVTSEDTTCSGKTQLLPLEVGVCLGTARSG